MVVITVLSSLVLTYLVLVAQERTDYQSLRNALVTGAIVPLVVAPPIFYFLFSLLARLYKSNRQIERLTRMDELTDCFNRRYFAELAERELALAKRHQSPVALLMLDINHFKRINDSCGHLAGDDVLRELVRRINQEVRATDIVGRFGGDEFLVLLPQTDAAGALETAERIRRKVAERPARVGDKTIDFVVSIGMATNQQGGYRLERLLSLADRAMFLAKEKGRNRVEVSNGALEATPGCAAPAWAGVSE